MGTKEQVVSLSKHLEKTKSSLNSGTVPVRHAGKEVAYRDFLRREISRTEKKLENIKPTVK